MSHIQRSRGVALGLFLSISLGCASQQGAGRGSGSVRLVTNVPDAVLYIDDVMYGPGESYERRAIPLPAGTHNFRFEHPEFRRETVRILVTEDVSVTVAVELSPRNARDHNADALGGEEPDG